jgi:hypothetical protein
MGATWLTSLAITIFYFMRMSLGVSFEPNFYTMAGIIGVETLLLGGMAFRSWWRLLALVPALSATYITLPLRWWWFR